MQTKEFQEGYDAFKAEQPQHTDDYPVGSQEYADWVNGWRTAYEEVVNAG